MQGLGCLPNSDSDFGGEGIGHELQRTRRLNDPRRRSESQRGRRPVDSAGYASKTSLACLCGSPVFLLDESGNLGRVEEEADEEEDARDC